MTNTTIDMGNNERATIGIVVQRDGTFLAITLSASKSFKTLAGAKRWLASRGHV